MSDEERLKEYLASKEGGGWRHLERLWADLRARYPEIPVPASYTSEFEPDDPWDGESYIFAWSFKGYYAEVEADGDGTGGWCYLRDIESEDTYCDDFSGDLPDWFVEKFRLVCA